MTERLSGLLAPRVFAVLLLAATAALCAWYLPYGMPTPDAGAALTHAAKILRGAVFYRDLDAYPFPAAPYLLAAAMHVFGESLAVARVFAALTYTAIVMAGYRLTLDLAGRGAAALCAVALLSLKFLAWPAFQDSLYPEVALAFAMASMIAFLHHDRTGQRRALAVAGALAALALLSKQNLGLYLAAAMPALLLLRAALRTDRPAVRAAAGDLAGFALPFSLPIGAALLFFWWHGVLGAMLYSGFIRPFRGYMPTSGLPFSVVLEWWRLGELQGMPGFAYSIGPLFEMLGMKKLPMPSWYPQYWLLEEAAVRLIYTAIPVIFAAAAFDVLRERSWRAVAGPFAGLAVLTLAVLASAFPRADYYHIASVYPVILVLGFVTGARLLARLRSRRLRASATALAAGLTVGVFAGTLALAAVYFHGMTYVAGNERGHMRIYPENAWADDILHYIDANLAEDDVLFVYGHEAYYYFFSGRFAPWSFVQLYPGMTGDDDAAALTASLEKKRPALVVKGLIAGWAGLPDVASYAGHLGTFVQSNYRPTAAPFADGVGPDATPPPGWLLEVLEPSAPTR